jgi:hypothetical protein
MKNFWFIKISVIMPVSALLLFLWSPFGHAGDCEVMIRNHEGALIKQREKGCFSAYSTEESSGKEFSWRILKGEAKPQSASPQTSERAESSWNDEDSLRANTIHHHLKIAETRTKELTAKQTFPRSLGHIAPFNVRFDVTSSYNAITHFAPTKKERGNLSLTIESGKSRNDSWPKEIWFYRSIPTRLTGRLHSTLRSFSEKSIRRAFFAQIALSRSRAWMIGSHDGAISELLTWLVFFEGALPLLTQTSKVIKTNQWLDSALIPEVIYHEWAHLLFAPVFGLKNSTSVNEGYANYWAARISSAETLLLKIPKNLAHGRYARVRSGEKKPNYHREVDESPAYRSAGQFVFTLLMEIERTFGTEIGQQLNLGALEYLNENSDALYAFPDALLKAAHSLETKAQPLTSTLIGILRSRGLAI